MFLAQRQYSTASFRKCESYSFLLWSGRGERGKGKEEVEVKENRHAVVSRMVLENCTDGNWEYNHQFSWNSPCLYTSRGMHDPICRLLVYCILFVTCYYLVSNLLLVKTLLLYFTALHSYSEIIPYTSVIVFLDFWLLLVLGFHTSALYGIRMSVLERDFINNSILNISEI